MSMNCQPSPRLRLLPLALLLGVMLFPQGARSGEPIDVGSRLEPLVDDFAIEKLSGKAELRMHRPIPREVAIVHDRPWEGNHSAYHTVFRDGDLYRMYYRGTQIDLKGNKYRFAHREVVCYAESKDGIRWTKPDLGLVEFDGSTKNNILWDGPGSHNFCPMKDTNPNAAPEARYKALGGKKGAKQGDGLYAFQSADAIHWSLFSDKPVMTKGAFDSQNLAFWDSVRGEYRAYFRDFRDGRDIKTCTSKDFLHWTEPVFLDYTDGRKTQLYTNQIIPYYRAPHVFLGFPTRYNADRGWLTPLNEQISQAERRCGLAYTDGGFMTSRDGNRFHVWGEAFLRPGPVHEGRWLYGGNYQNWGLVETEAEPGPADMQPFLPKNSAREISIYATEGGWVGKGNRMRRYTLRIDGFVSVQAPASGGEMLTKPLVFDGRRLIINFATSAAGSLRVEIQDTAGTPAPGFALADCPDVFGDAIEHPVEWKGDDDVSPLAGKPVRLRFVLRDADLYSIRFQREPAKADRWEQAIRDFEAQDRKSAPAQGGIVFVGSSSIRLWKLAESFPGLIAMNRGFGGSELADSVRYADRIVIPYRPRIVVLYAGDNDLASGKSPERVLADFKQFVAKVHAALPKTRIVYIGIKPSLSRWKLIDKVREANRRIKDFVAADPRLIFIDVEPPMLGPDGKPRPDLFQPDGLHVNAAGYKLWADLLRPHLKP